MTAWDGSVSVTPDADLARHRAGHADGRARRLSGRHLVLRLRAAYLALFTLGFSEIVKAVISAEIDITRGQAGMELPPLFPDGVTLFGQTFGPTDKIPPYYAMFGLLLLCLAILTWLARSRFGLFVRALREDQDAAAALGVNTTRYKVVVFTITCAMAATAGAVQAHYVQIVTPEHAVLAADEPGRRDGGDRRDREFRRRGAGRDLSADHAGGAAHLLHHRRRRGRHDGLAAGVLRALLMVTLRFFRNGLIAPLIDRFRRAGVAAETVEKRTATLTGPGGGPHRADAAEVPE
jgi:branched-chain amino acid transport system permease protein